MTMSTMMAEAATTATQVAYGAADVANLPLLLPFQIRIPAESALIASIMNEQQASITLAAAMKREEKLRTDLQKAASSSSSDDKNELATKNKGGSRNAAIIANSKKRGRSVATVAVMKTIQNQIQAQQHVVAQCQQNLVTVTTCTRAMVQAEYSKRAVILDPESRQYRDLEEAYLFFSARIGKKDGVPIDDPDNYYHEQRIAYVREMLPIMRKVGTYDTRESIAELPYVRQAQCEDALLDAFRDEKYKLAIAEGLRRRLDKNCDYAKNKVLRHAEELLTRSEVEASDLVRKWYRRRSVKLHPDRNGERMRPVFEEFKDACNVLSDINLRQRYLGNMLELTYVYCSHHATLAGLADSLLHGHDMWNRRYRPDKVEGKKELVKKDTAGKTEKTLQLEGGLHQQMPKGVIWHQRYVKSSMAMIHISIHALSPIYDFYARVRSVCVELRSSHNQTHTLRLSRANIVKTIRMEGDSPILASEVLIVEKALHPGNWEAYWFAELDVVGTDPLNPQNATENESVVTRHSAVRSFEIVDCNHVSLLQSFDQAESTCKVVKGELASILHKIQKNQSESVPGRTPLSPFELSRERYGLYHQTLVRARKKCHALMEIMTKLGRKSTVCDELSALLSQCRQVFSDLEEAVVANNKRKEKKVDVKRFKSYIASIVEGDDPMAWMKNVTSAELSNEGGDVNRLYQLFIEGKGLLGLRFDSDVFKEASLREDLFSAKQRKDLAAKSGEAAAMEAKEEEEANVTKNAEEAERTQLRKEGELREKWSMVDHYVTIHSLTSELGKKLNKKLAKIIYFHADKDRFEVGIYQSDKKFLLKGDNLTMYYGYVPEPKPKQPLQEQPTNRKVVKAAQKQHPSSAPKVNPASSVASKNSSTATRNPNEPKLKEYVADNNGDENVITAVPQDDHKPILSTMSNVINYDAKKMKTTIYVRSAHSKKLTGKRGRKKEALVKKSGVVDVHIGISAIANQVPVNLIGTYEANLKAIAFIQEEVGIENVSEKFEKQPSSIPPTPPRSTILPPPAVVSPASTAPVPTLPASVLPTSSAPERAPAAPVSEPPGLVRKMSTLVANSYQTITTSIFANSFANGGVDHDVLANIGSELANSVVQHVVPMSPSESEPASHTSFDDALLPCGLMDLSISTPTKLGPREVPSEIGIRSQVTRETITITDYGDRSSTSKASYNLNENDPLLMFLRSQHQCFKGNIEEFYIWLVKSEDIDSMSTLKEAVSDSEYLSDSMRVGCGTSGLKGFKQRVFQRAVMEYRDNNMQQAGILSSMHNTSSPMRGSINGDILLPANLFSDFDIGY